MRSRRPGPQLQVPLVASPRNQHIRQPLMRPDRQRLSTSPRDSRPPARARHRAVSRCGRSSPGSPDEPTRVAPRLSAPAPPLAASSSAETRRPFLGAARECTTSSEGGSAFRGTRTIPPFGNARNREAVQHADGSPLGSLPTLDQEAQASSVSTRSGKPQGSGSVRTGSRLVAEHQLDDSWATLPRPCSWLSPSLPFRRPSTCTPHSTCRCC